MIDNNLEIPGAWRDLAQQSVSQAREAFDKFIAATRQAQSVAAASTEPAAATVKEIQKRSFQFAEQNAEASFALASELAKARDLNEWIAVQQQHAKRQTEAYTLQSQELARLIAAMQAPRS